MSNVLVESLAVGLAVMILGLVLMWIAKAVFPQANMNSLMAHAIMLFILGVSLHLFSECLGINAWYCQKGYACQRR